MRVFRTVVYTVLILAILVTMIVKQRQRAALLHGGSSAAEALVEATKAHIPAWLFVQSPVCQTCQQMEKVYQKLEPFFAGKVEFVKVDISSPADQDLVRRFNVRLVPTSVFIASDGKVMARKIGAIPLSETKTILIGLRKR